MKYLFILASVFFTITAFSQPKVKLTAYAQSVTPGIIPRGITDENTGKELPIKPFHGINYFIYLSLKKSSSVAPTQIWINGQAYKVGQSLKMSTPVTQVNENIPSQPKTIVLVPATSDAVYQLSLGEKLENAPKTANLKKMVDKNSLVVVYRWKNKNYYVGVKEFKILEPVATM